MKFNEPLNSLLVTDSDHTRVLLTRITNDWQWPGSLQIVVPMLEMRQKKLLALKLESLLHLKWKIVVLIIIRDFLCTEVNIRSGFIQVNLHCVGVALANSIFLNNRLQSLILFYIKSNHRKISRNSAAVGLMM